MIVDDIHYPSSTGRGWATHFFDLKWDIERESCEPDEEGYCGCRTGAPMSFAVEPEGDAYRFLHNWGMLHIPWEVL